MKNLKPKELSLFASSPNITLEHLHELRTDKKSLKSKSEPWTTEESSNKSVLKKKVTSFIKVTPLIPDLVTDKNSSQVQKELTGSRLLNTDKNLDGISTKNLLKRNTDEMSKDDISNEFMSEKTVVEICDELEEHEDAHKEIYHVEELRSLDAKHCAEDLKNVDEISIHSEYIPKPSPVVSAVPPPCAASVPHHNR